MKFSILIAICTLTSHIDVAGNDPSLWLVSVNMNSHLNPSEVASMAWFMLGNHSQKLKQGWKPSLYSTGSFYICLWDSRFHHRIATQTHRVVNITKLAYPGLIHCLGSDHWMRHLVDIYSFSQLRHGQCPFKPDTSNGSTVKTSKFHCGPENGRTKHRQWPRTSRE